MKGNKIYSLMVKLVIASLFVYIDADVQEIVQLIKNGMDNATNPCDNYYQHICGLWNFQNRKIDFFQSAREKMDPIAKDILQQPESDTDSIKLSMEKKWYKVCVRQNISSANGFQRLKEIYESSLRLQKWTEISLHYTQIFGQSIFFDIELNEEHMIKVVKPSKLSRMLTTVSDEMFNKFVHEKIQFLDMYFTPEETYLENDLIFLLYNYRQEVSKMLHITSITTIRKIQKKFNDLEVFTPMANINWLNYFKAMGINLNSDDRMEIEFNPVFLDAIISIIFYNEPRIQAKFIHFMYIMNDDIITYWNQFFPALPNNILSTKCLKEMPIKMGVVEEIIQNHLQEKVSFFKRVYENVYETLERKIKNSKLRKDDKIYTLGQLRNIEFQLPGIYANRKNLMANEISYEFEISSCGLENLINFNKAQLKFKVEKYKQQYYGTQVSATSHEIRKKRDLHLNSSDSKKHNKLEIVAEHLLTNLFSNDAPISWNYGHLAFFIGHELSHVFDNIHSSDNDTINPSIYNHFKCYAKQVNKFGRFQIRSTNNEVLRAQRQMMKEIVADSVGLKIAYKAFKKLLKDKAEIKNQRLPYFNELNENKLFFTSFATQFCQQPLRVYKSLDTHLPNDIRVIMAVENLKEFSTIFNCDKDSFTKSLERCDLLD
ncbi:neprilysin-like [Leptopilina heterotoma]|uniref:neprilysin-like n=1 Tax=Leptopilina heterotoma TaxID=63436 RepID=UPI001CA7BD86|nr:neprilysin-like [Leptopilina heterotoma]